MAGNVHEGEVTRVFALTPEVRQIDIAVGEPISFRPGQFISLRVGDDADGSAILRSYSLASSPGQKVVSLVVKLFGGGIASEWFRRLEPGAEVRFTGPMGFFVLDLQHPGDVIIAATGVGIAPVRPMLEELLTRNETGRVKLFWSLREPEQLFWQDEFRALAARHPRFAPEIHLTGAAQGWSGARGRINSAVLSTLSGLERPTFYLVGHGAMVRELKAQLVERGVDRKKQIRNEIFYD